MKRWMTIGVVLLVVWVNAGCRHDTPNQDSSMRVDATSILTGDRGGATFDLAGEKFTIYPVRESAPDAALVGVSVQVVEQGELVALYIDPGSDSGLLPQFMLVKPEELANDQRIIITETYHVIEFDNVPFDTEAWQEIAAIPAEEMDDYVEHNIGDEDSIVLFAPTDASGQPIADLSGTILHFVESPFEHVLYAWVDQSGNASKVNGHAASVVSPPTLLISVHPTYFPIYHQLVHYLHIPFPGLEDRFIESYRSLHEVSPETEELYAHYQVYLTPGEPTEAVELESTMELIDEAESEIIPEEETASDSMESVSPSPNVEKTLDAVTPTVQESEEAPTEESDETPRTDAVVDSDGLTINVRRGPGEEFATWGVLYDGDPVTSLGTTPARDWVYIERENGNKGWVAAPLLEFIGKSLNSLPIADYIPTLPPTSTPRPTSTQRPTSTPPRPTSPPSAEATISFRANTTTITEGECATLSWDVEHIRAVYLGNEGVTGHGSERVCPSRTTTYYLTVTHTDGHREQYSITIGVVNTTAVEPIATNTLPPPELTPIPSTPVPTIMTVSVVGTSTHDHGPDQIWTAYVYMKVVTSDGEMINGAVIDYEWSFPEPGYSHTDTCTNYVSWGGCGSGSNYVSAVVPPEYGTIVNLRVIDVRNGDPYQWDGISEIVTISRPW
jgi:hypothetical protein